ncbi:coiled-coil domain-containing protein 117 [Astyanax mexicanus]|uniref:Coiled-coil domain-containing protein 117 n=2 Tax=Astyanax mexicanus TaxID=7994 RepID=A0A8T2KR22_ASTMX|nr:coiled-coil domain-containing protein 117 [Astyanax mexicanus]
MQSARSGGRDLGYLPSVYSPLPNLPPPEMGVSRGPNFSGSDHLPGGSMTSLSWERRCVRKHRRRTDDVGCSAKRRKLMEEAESEPSDYPDPKPCWTMEDPTRPPLTRLGTEVLHSGPSSQEVGVAFSAPVRPESEGSCMEVEAAQRKLQEIEDRITLEDDSDEDLDVDPAQRRPVLVLSDSLREGLQRGIGDILPETVAQSVSRSCMELVLWRPPEDPLTQQLKDSIQRQQRKQQPACRQTPAPVPRTPVPDRLQPKPQPEPAFRSLYCPPVAPGGGEEEMELETFY